MKICDRIDTFRGSTNSNEFYSAIRLLRLLLSLMRTLPLYVAQILVRRWITYGIDIQFQHSHRDFIIYKLNLCSVLTEPIQLQINKSQYFHFSRSFVSSTHLQGDFFLSSTHGSVWFAMICCCVSSVVSIALSVSYIRLKTLYNSHQSPEVIGQFACTVYCVLCILINET